MRLQTSEAGIEQAKLEARLLLQLSQDGMGLSIVTQRAKICHWQENAGILRCFDFRMQTRPVPTLELLLELFGCRDFAKLWLSLRHSLIRGEGLRRSRAFSQIA